MKRRDLKTHQINSQEELVDFFDTHFPALKDDRREKRERDLQIKRRKRAGREQ